MNNSVKWQHLVVSSAFSAHPYNKVNLLQEWAVLHDLKFFDELAES